MRHIDSFTLFAANFMYCSTSCRDEFYKYADFVPYSKIFEKLVVIFNKMVALVGGLENVKKLVRPKDLPDFYSEQQQQQQEQIEEEEQTEEDFRKVYDNLPLMRFFTCDEIETRECACLLNHDFSDPNQFQLNMIKCLLVSYESSFRFSHDMETVRRYPHRQQINTLDSLLNNNALAFRHYLPGQKGLSADDGSFFSPFFFTLNTACDRNITHENIDNKCVFYVEKPIKAGEELFVALA
jgi:hypothetical protein